MVGFPLWQYHHPLFIGAACLERVGAGGVLQLSPLCGMWWNVVVTVATKITVARILLVPVFAVYAVAYGVGVAAGDAWEGYRYFALAVFVLAAGSDGVDGWVARRFNQKSELGAFLDPIADKLLLLTAVVTLALVDWGEDGWHLPVWFAVVVFARDALILIGIGWLYTRQVRVRIKPHWIGKWCTVAQMFAVGWVMLRVFPVSPAWPCAVAAALTLVSAYLYLRKGVQILRAQKMEPQVHTEAS